jgi:hypothetical protein
MKNNNNNNNNNNLKTQVQEENGVLLSIVGNEQ